MIPLTTLHDPSGRRSLTDAYTELFLDSATLDPAFGPIVLVRDPQDESPQPLHRGTILACEVFAGTTDPECDTIYSLRDSLADLYEIPWLTIAQVQTLINLAARPEELAHTEVKARTIAVDREGGAIIEAYGCKISLERNWWIIRLPAGKECYRCLRLSSAMSHALINRHTAYAQL